MDKATVNAILPSWATINEDGIGIIELNGVKLEVDMTDPDFYEQFMAIARQMKDYKSKAGASNGESLAEQVEMMDDFFDDLFGEDTAARIFKNRSLMARLNLFKAMSDIGNLQEAVIRDNAAQPVPKLNPVKDSKILPMGGDPAYPRNRKERREAARREQQARNRKG